MYNILKFLFPLLFVYIVNAQVSDQVYIDFIHRYLAKNPPELQSDRAIDEIRDGVKNGKYTFDDGLRKYLRDSESYINYVEQTIRDIPRDQKYDFSVVGHILSIESYKIRDSYLREYAQQKGIRLY